MATQKKDTNKYIVFRTDPVESSDKYFSAISNGIYNTKEAAYGAIMSDVVDIYGLNKQHIGDNDIDVSLPMQISENNYRIDVFEVLPKYGNNEQSNILLSYYILSTNNSKGDIEKCE